MVWCINLPVVVRLDREVDGEDEGDDDDDGPESAIDPRQEVVENVNDTLDCRHSRIFGTSGLVDKKGKIRTTTKKIDTRHFEFW